MLTDAELADLQNTQAETLVQTCVIKSRTLVSDGAGGHTETETTIDTVDCRLAPTELSRGEERFAEQLQGQVPYRVTLPSGTIVELHNWFEIGARTFDPMAIRGPRTFQTALNVLCRERKD